MLPTPTNYVVGVPSNTMIFLVRQIWVNCVFRESRGQVRSWIFSSGTFTFRPMAVAG
jgi:hypothetical protein